MKTLLFVTIALCVGIGLGAFVRFGTGYDEEVRKASERVHQVHEEVSRVQEEVKKIDGGVKGANLLVKQSRTVSFDTIECQIRTLYAIQRDAWDIDKAQLTDADLRDREKVVAAINKAETDALKVVTLLRKSYGD